MNTVSSYLSSPPISVAGTCNYNFICNSDFLHLILWLSISHHLLLIYISASLTPSRLLVLYITSALFSPLIILHLPVFSSCSTIRGFRSSLIYKNFLPLLNSKYNNHSRITTKFLASTLLFFTIIVSTLITFFFSSFFLPPIGVLHISTFSSLNPRSCFWLDLYLNYEIIPEYIYIYFFFSFSSTFFFFNHQA